MKTKLSIFGINLLFFSLISLNCLQAQETRIIDYECMDMPFEVEAPNESIHLLTCVEGQAVIDTLEDPCFDFYEEDGVVIKAWYYLNNDFESSLEYFFDGISLKMEETFESQGSKFLELKRSTLWMYFQANSGLPQSANFRVKDLSNGGINFGISLEDGAQYFPSFEALANHDFPEIQIDYSEEYLSIEGELERIFIGGDHLYVEKVSLDPALISSTEELGKDNFHIYPNPAAEQLIIQGKFPTGSRSSIVNNQGQVLQTTILNENNQSIDISELQNGFYWLQVSYENKRLNTKSFLVQ